MTGLKNLVVQIHAKDQSFMNLALLWENTGYIEPGIQSSKYYHGIVKKRLNTKKYSCAKDYVKHYQCVDNFFMKQMNCSFPWIKSYKGSLPKCWANKKVFELINLIRTITNFKELYQEMLEYGCEMNCETTSWTETKSIPSINRENAKFSKLLVFIPATVQVGFSNLLSKIVITYYFNFLGDNN